MKNTHQAQSIRMDKESLREMPHFFYIQARGRKILYMNNPTTKWRAKDSQPSYMHQLRTPIKLQFAELYFGGAYHHLTHYKYREGQGGHQNIPFFMYNNILQNIIHVQSNNRIVLKTTKLSGWSNDHHTPTVLPLVTGPFLWLATTGYWFKRTEACEKCVEKIHTFVKIFQKHKIAVLHSS
jgi:hypothetical protein